MADFLKQNWGNLASVLGLVVSVGVLWVAQKAREAAEEARSLARLKSLLEELESATNRVQLIEVLLRDRKWDTVQLLVGELLSACRSALARWADHLAESSRDKLATACSELQSIARTCNAPTEQLTNEEWRQTMEALQKARELIVIALGQVKGAEERSAQPNA